MKKLAILLLILIAAIGYFFLETKPFATKQQDDLVADNSELINPNLCTGRLTDFEPCLQLKASFSEKEITKKDKTSEELLALGIRYELGIGVTADYKKALDYYFRSAKETNDAPSALIGYHLVKDYIANANFYINEEDYSSSKFDEDIQEVLYFTAYSIIKEKQEARYPLAVTILQEANKEKYPHAYVLLAEVYIKGLGVKADPSKGLDYLAQGTDAKYPYAIAMLGVFYVTGDTVEKNEKLGYEMLQEAIDLGNEGAEELMQQLKENGGKLDV